MSRLYLVEVHVKAPEEKYGELVGRLEEWGMGVATPCRDGEVFQSYEDGYLIYDGEITLGGRKDEYEAHAELKKLISYPLITKWNCVEFNEWDEVIRDED